MSKKKVDASDLIKGAPTAPVKNFELQKRLDRLRNKKEPTRRKNNLSPLTSPP